MGFSRIILIFLSDMGLSNQQIIVVREKILQAINLIEQHPEMGQIEPYLAHLKLNHRRIAVDYYKVVYRISGSYIFVTDLFDARQDPEKLSKRV